MTLCYVHEFKSRYMFEHNFLVFFFPILTLIISSMHEHRVLMTYLSLSMIDVTVNVHVTNKTQIINHDQMIYIHNIMNNTQNSESAMNTGLVM